MAHKIDPFHSPRPAGAYFSGKVRSAAGSLPVFPVPISEPRNVVEVPDMCLEEFVDTGIAMGAAAFYAWSCCLADSIPVNRSDLDRLGALARTVGVIEEAARILEVAGSGAVEIAEEVQDRYPAASTWPGSRDGGGELPSLLDEPGAHVVGFAVHGIVHVATLPDNAAIKKALKLAKGPLRLYIEAQSGRPLNRYLQSID